MNSRKKLVSRSLKKERTSVDVQAQVPQMWELKSVCCCISSTVSRQASKKKKRSLQLLQKREEQTLFCPFFHSAVLGAWCCI